jgi:type II secretory pathway pseudopilin PulG
MNHVAKRQQGFTIIELMLAMTFIAFLLLAIALTIIQIGAIYNKGTTFKEINQTSRDLNDDLDRTINAAGSVTLATDYVQTPNAANPVGGRLCLGSYSYIWNFEKAIASNDPNIAKYKNPPSGQAPTAAIRFVKVPDSGKIYCAKNGNALVNKDILGTDVDRSQELLKVGDHELGLHQFTIITPPATAIDLSTGQQIYSIAYTLGTSNIAALNATQTACLAPTIVNADPLYCNVQQFSLVVRVGNGVN